MRGPITITFLLNAASLPGIVIERAIATYFSSKYERFGRKIAVILIVIQSAIGSGTFLILAKDIKLYDSTTKTVYCSFAKDENSTNAAAIFVCYMIADLISAITFPILLSINKKFHRRKTQASLSERYQISENISSIQTLSPLVAFHSVLLAFYLGALGLYFAVNFNFSTKQFAVYLESVQQTPIYALTLPLAIIYTEKYVKKTTQKSREKAIGITGTEAAKHYFTIFEVPPRRNSRNM
uniref:G-protein coupled receptors family 1 profile domain-containing protein n=1 Tax=Setaria digitata TaxID=48799 RepID=A0A915PLV1_9BILA